MNTEYYYEEDYPDCIGEIEYYSKQPACLTCVWKKACLTEIEWEDTNSWEDDYDY